MLIRLPQEALSIQSLSIVTQSRLVQTSQDAQKGKESVSLYDLPLWQPPVHHITLYNFMHQASCLKFNLSLCVSTRIGCLSLMGSTQRSQQWLQQWPSHPAAVLHEYEEAQFAFTSSLKRSASTSAMASAACRELSANYLPEECSV